MKSRGILVALCGAALAAASANAEDRVATGAAGATETGKSLPTIEDFSRRPALSSISMSLEGDMLVDGDLIADFTGDGVFNFLDISEFLAQYAVGCP